MVTSCSFPSWATVTRAGDVVTGGVVQTVTDLATAIAVCSRRAFLFTVPSHESRAAGTLPRDVIAVSSILTLAYQCTVLAIEAQRASLSAVEPRPARSAFAFPVIGAAKGSIVAVAGMDAVRTPVGWWTGLGAVTANPAWVALTGPVDGVTGAVVGAGTNTCTVLPKSATGTHFIAQGAGEARQAVTQACDVVAGPAAVHTLWACLATAVSIKARGADSLASGASESGCAFTDAVIGRTRSPIFTVAGQRAVRTPASLSTHTVTVHT